MRLVTLRVQGMRSLEEVSLALGEGLHVFVGPNGAGKTSLLEAAFLLSHGRSFRSGVREALVQRGRAGLAIFSDILDAAAVPRRVGLGRQGGRWEARVDGEAATLGELVKTCAVVCFEPGSHALIAGAAEERRRYLDWGVFHVEPPFLVGWRRYQRALRQRNALLRGAVIPTESLLAPWESELDENARLIDLARARYLQALVPVLARALGHLLPELGAIDLRYRRGWSEDAPLGEVLARSREADRARGFTLAGPHRADWSLGFEHAPAREFLSRGQEKLTALGCVLAQAELHAESLGDWPVVCLDDLASELDDAHQEAVVSRLAGVDAQVLVTGTHLPAALHSYAHRMFHVEQGRVTPLV